MRGKKKATTRHTAFRNRMLAAFCSDSGITSEFIAFLRTNEDINWAYPGYVEDESLLFFSVGLPTVIYQILRLVEKPVLLRQLEILSNVIWGGKKGNHSLYTAICVLYSVNLIDYQLRDFGGSPSDVLQFTVKEDV